MPNTSSVSSNFYSLIISYVNIFSCCSSFSISILATKQSEAECDAILFWLMNHIFTYFTPSVSPIS